VIGVAFGARLAEAQVGDEAAFACLFDRASWIVGANIVVDGGQRYRCTRQFEQR